MTRGRSRRASRWRPAQACGEIANATDVQRLMPFHFSRRYEDTPQRVYAEAASVCFAYAGAEVVLGSVRPASTGRVALVYTRNWLERHFRDAQTLRHPGFVSANRYEAVGQV